MTRIGAVVLITWGLALVAHAQVHITNFTQNGELTWTSPSGSVSTIEWTGSLTPTPDWRGDWLSLKYVYSTNTFTTVTVPMFYRVMSWTNGLFLEIPVGRTYVYRASNILNQVWTQEGFIAGMFTIPSLQRDYVFLFWTNIYDGTTPLGSGESESWFLRTTDRAAYWFSGLTDLSKEELEWQDGPIGTTTNWSGDDPPEPIVTTIESTNATVVVAAGTFPNCVQFLHTMTNRTPPHTQWREWVKPGFFLVKCVDLYDEDDSEAYPVTYELQSWRDKQ